MKFEENDDNSEATQRKFTADTIEIEENQDDELNCSDEMSF